MKGSGIDKDRDAESKPIRVAKASRGEEIAIAGDGSIRDLYR